MGRRPKSSLAEDILAIVSKMPWWVAMALAVISYVTLHSYAGQPTNFSSTSAIQISSYMMPAILKGLATAGQFIMPILFCAAALMSWVRQRKHASNLLAVSDVSTEQHQANAGVSPSCPICSSQMVLRVSKRGSNAGKSFWGCSQYPRCKGTRISD